jgi:hypothetical protein
MTIVLLERYKTRRWRPECLCLLLLLRHVVGNRTITMASLLASPDGGAVDTVQALNLQNFELVSLDGMPTMASLEILNVSDNRLTNFYGIPTHPSLRCLEASHNRITSLLGMSHQPSLEIVLMDGNPICAHPEFRLMVLLACGETVSIINHRIVTDDERRVAQRLGGSGGWAARCISFGWTDVTPVDRSDRAYEQLVEDLKVNYVAMVRCLDRNYSYGAVMTRREPLTSEPAARRLGLEATPFASGPAAAANGLRHYDSAERDDLDRQPHGGAYGRTGSRSRSGSGSRGRDEPAASMGGYFVDAARQPAPGRSSYLAGATNLTGFAHRQHQHQAGVKQQLTLNDLNSFYQSTGAPKSFGFGSSTGGDGFRDAARTQPSPAPSYHQRPHGVNAIRQDVAVPAHYSAVDAARRYAAHFKQNGTVVGANVMDVFPAPEETSAGVAHAKRAEVLGREAVQQQQNQLPARIRGLNAAALVLMQSEVGCLSGVDIDNVDVAVTDGGTTFIRNALCRITGGGQLHIMEGSHVVYEVRLPVAREISLDKVAATVRILPEAASTVGFVRGDGVQVEVKVREAVGDADARSNLARGVFKLLMLFKCTPDELETFYATTLIRA